MGFEQVGAEIYWALAAGFFSFFFRRNRHCMENMQGSILPMPTGVDPQVDWGLVARFELECS